MKQRNNLLKRAVIIWLLFIPIAFLNGIIREFVYKPFVGDLQAHQISTVIACIAFVLLAYVQLKKYISSTSSKTLLHIGFLWVAITIMFEFVFGRFVTGAPWSKLLHDYNLLEGRIWIFFLLTLLMTPLFIKQFRGKASQDYTYVK